MTGFFLFRLPGCRLAWLALLFCIVAGGRAESLADRVVILANSDDPDSVKLARYYAGKRAIPEENIIALKLPRAEAISWREFVGSLYQPLQDELVQRAWIDAIGMNLTDAVGRRKYAVSGHRVAYLVVCRGVPLRVENEPALVTEVPGPLRKPEFRTNVGAVDSELSLLAQSGYAITAFVTNPLFNNERPYRTDLGQVIKVARLDGPTYADARRLVDQAVAAEETGLVGRSYVDLKGPYPLGDRWLEATLAQLEELGFDGEVERTGATFGETSRFDAPALYFGWYTGTLNGPFALPDFRFPPGAIALHIHSYSAATLRSPTQNWLGPLIARGVTATFGNVTEPYLELTHQPQLLLRALVRGSNLGDAAYFAMPALSWQGIVIGDPLYRPFTVSLDEQWRRRGALPPLVAPYVALRKIRLSEREGRPAEALKLAREAMRDTPSFAGAVELARQLEKAGDLPSAKRTLELLTTVKTIRLSELSVALVGAKWLRDRGESGRAVAVCKKLLENKTLPKKLRVAVLEQAQEFARAANDLTQAAAFQAEIARLAAPVDTKK